MRHTKRPIEIQRIAECQQCFETRAPKWSDRAVIDRLDALDMLSEQDAQTLNVVWVRVTSDGSRL